MKQLLDNNMISGLEVNKTQNLFSCNACIKSKITHKPLPKQSRERAKKLGDRVYSNVWGPSKHLTIDKKQYYVSFINDYSRESVLYLMQTKDEVFQKYKLYEAMMLCQRDVNIKSLVSDHGGKYTSKEFNDYLAKQGTNHRLKVHDTPESNGVAERLNRTLVDRTRIGFKAAKIFMGLCYITRQLRKK